MSAILAVCGDTFCAMVSDGRYVEEPITGEKPHILKPQKYGSGDPKGSRGRSQTSSVFIAPLSPPQRRNPCNTIAQSA